MDFCDLVRDLRSNFFAKDRDITIQSGRGVYISGGGEITVPIGGIILWSGAIVDIPTGWALCDGTSGTPDLTDRFVVGAGDSYAVDDTGGATTHTHGDGSYATDSDSHSHGDGSLVNSSAGSHDHGGDTSFDDVYGSWTTGGTTGASWQHTHPISSDGSHTHTITGTTASDSHSHDVTGTSASANSRPPYYALAYIMRIT